MEDFVTYDLALKLKDKGFNWICSHYYRTKCKDLFMVFPSEDWSNTEERINAPTISQVLKWLREEKLILIGLSPMQEYDCNEIIEWCCTIFRADKQGGLSWQEEFYYQSYEQSALAGIEYALNYLL